ncbi:hypothetical protein ACWDX6_23900 [Streptomyces sp. NPDC003027]
MNEYTAHSAHSGSSSVARAFKIGRWVLVSSEETAGSASTAMTPGVARTFARGLLALADEADGGDDTRPQVGDRVRVLEDHPQYAPALSGDVITVAAVDYDSEGADYIRYRADGDDYLWFVPLTAVELVDEPAAPDAAVSKETPEPYRESLLIRAKELAGPHADPGAVLQYARFLAGE